MKTKFRAYLLLFLIVILGLFLRTWNINDAPPGVYPDEAVNGIDAQTANDTGEYQWFYPANNGREGLFMNLIALCFNIWGTSVLTLKLPSIICGTLTIWGTFLLAKEIFKKNRVGLMSAFLVATSFWAINFSRISFRANMLPVILVFSFYFLFRGLRTRKTIDFALGGLIFGLGLHSYIAFRIAPLILVATFVAILLTRRNFIKEYWKQIVTFIVFCTLSAAPMLYTFFIAHPESWESRTGSVSVFNSEINDGHPIKAFLRSFGLSLAKYTFWGDQNWRHNYPPYPLLDPVSGVAFLFGFIYSLWRFLRLAYQRIFKKISSSRLEVYTFLISWFFIMLVPEFMTAEGNPHALRAIGTIPVVFIFSSLTFEFFIRKSELYTPLFKKMVIFIITLMFISIGLFNAIKYHYFWAKSQETARSFDKNLMDVSIYLKTLPPSEEKFIVAESMQRIPIQLFNWNMPNTHYIYPGELKEINPMRDNFSIIMTDENSEVLNYLIDKFPDLKVEKITNEFNLNFYVMK
ncbi:MAG TPA: glycosyltransferase family 39 protein [Candidatus Moranbacteria bacterium]|nr:glycosyltransferase family 39 protein [Candidatus Moranbacteria bacterium]